MDRLLSGSGKFIIILIFLVALLPRLWVAVTSEIMPNYDALGYDQNAQSIISGKGISAGGKPISHKPPFYPLFLAGVYYIFGHSYLAVRIIQAVIGALSCLIIYSLAKDLLGRKIALISAVLSIFYPVFIKSTEHLLTECLFILLISLIGFYLLKIKKFNDLKNSVLLGFFMGISALTRANMLFFPFFVLILGMAGFFKIKERVKYLLLAVALTSFVITIAPWTIRNYIVHKAFIPIATQGGEVFYTSYNPPKGYLYGFTANDDVISFANKLGSEVEQNKFLIKYTFGTIKAKIRQIPRLELLKMLYFWSPFDWEILSSPPGKGVYNFFYAFFLPFSIAGIVILGKRIKEHSELFIPVIFILLTTLIFYGSPRFRMPAEPFLIIFAASGIYHFYRKLCYKNAFLLFLILFALNFVFYIYSDQLKITIRHIFINLGIWG